MCVCVRARDEICLQLYMSLLCMCICNDGRTKAVAVEADGAKLAAAQLALQGKVGLQPVAGPVLPV